MLKRVIVTGAAVLLASCAGGSAPTAEGARQSDFATGRCFRGDDVNNYNVKDRHTVYVSTRRGYVYRLVAEGDCFRPGTIGISVARFRMGDDGVCIGDETAVNVAQWRGSPSACLTRVSGPIRDSRVSGLRSRQD